MSGNASPDIGCNILVSSMPLADPSRSVVQWFAAVAQGDDKWSAFDRLVSSTLGCGARRCARLAGSPWLPPRSRGRLAERDSSSPSRRETQALLPPLSKRRLRQLWRTLGHALTEARWPPCIMQHTLALDLRDPLRRETRLSQHLRLLLEAPSS